MIDQAARAAGLKAQIAAIYERDMLSRFEPRLPGGRIAAARLCEIAAELKVFGYRIRTRGCDESAARMHRQMTETLAYGLLEIGAEDDLAGSFIEGVLAAGCLLDEGLLIDFTSGSA